jgi:hypothetical protein
MIVVAGSGRVADAIVAVLAGSEPTEEKVRKLVPAVKRLNLTQHRDPFEVFPLERGPSWLSSGGAGVAHTSRGAHRAIGTGA